MKGCLTKVILLLRFSSRFTAARKWPLACPEGSQIKPGPPFLEPL